MPEKGATKQTIRGSISQRDGEATANDADEPVWDLPVISVVGDQESAQESSEIQLYDILGQGGMGVVFNAHQRSLNRDVAVKMLRSTTRTRLELDGLRREAELIGSLDHPNIITVHAVGRCQERGPVLILKRVDGVSWDALIHEPSNEGWDGVRGDRLNYHLEILTSVCRAVEFSHSRGILHRDIKPENVMVGSYGEVYLLDWGVAIRLDQAKGLSAENLVGSPAFMAPEMTGGGDLSEATDVFLLGATLHEVLTGSPRHPGDSIFEVLYQASLSAPHEFDEDVPDLIAAICNKACAPHPEDRFANVADFRHALGSYIHHQGLTQVCRAAEERLARILAMSLDTNEDSILEVRRRFDKCRFGFQQVLNEWPDHRRAKQGLRGAIIAMIKRENLAGNHQNSRQLLIDLEEPPEELRVAVADMEEQAKAQRDAQERLDLLQGQQRFFGADWSRSIAVACNGLVWCLGLIFGGYLVHTEIGDPTPLWNLGFGFLWLLAAGGGGYLLRRLMVPNRIFARFMELGAFLPVFGIINRLVTLCSERSFHETLLVDYFLVAVCVAGVGLIERSLLLTAVITALGAVVTSQFPEYGLQIAGPLGLVVNLHIAWLLRPGRRTG